MAAAKLKFRTAAQADAEAERMEAMREDEVSSLREQGREADADRASDRWAREIDAVRYAATGLRDDERAAHEKNERRAKTKRAVVGGKNSAAHALREAPAKFDAKEVLRRTGMRVRNDARASRSNVAQVGNAFEKIGAGDFTGTAGNVFVIVLGGILGLIMLDLLLSKRGSSIAAAGAKWAGGLLGRLVSPTDPLTFGAKGAVLTPPSAGAGTAAAAPARVANNGGQVPKPTTTKGG